MKPKKGPTKLTAAEQTALFKQTARDLGANESPEAFDRTLRRITPGKPAAVPTKKPARAE